MECLPGQEILESQCRRDQVQCLRHTRAEHRVPAQCKQQLYFREHLQYIASLLDGQLYLELQQQCDHDSERQGTVIENYLKDFMKYILSAIFLFASVAMQAQTQFLAKGKIEFERKINVHRQYEANDDE